MSKIVIIRVFAFLFLGCLVILKIFTKDALGNEEGIEKWKQVSQDWISLIKI